MITVFLADEHRVIRDSLHSLIQAEPDIEVVGEADDGLRVLRMAEDLHPDVLVLDPVMKGINGLEVIRQLTELMPPLRVVVLSINSDEPYVLKYLKAGARAYVLKECCADDLVRAIRYATSGLRFLSHPLSERAVDAYIGTPRIACAPIRGLAR